jgi:hypothetical protein
LVRVDVIAASWMWSANREPRDAVQGTDPREATEDADQTTSDVHQCRTLSTFQTKKGPVSAWSGDLGPHDGGIDQNVYGDQAP